MNRIVSRALAVSLLLLAPLQMLVAPGAVAGNGTVTGRLLVQGVTVPPGSVVRATPAEGGQAVTSALTPDLTYSFASLSEGSYLFEVVDKGGHVIGTGIKTHVPTGQVQLDLVVKPQGPPGTATPHPAKPAGSHMSNGKKWGIIGGVVGGLLVAGAAASGGSSSSDHQGSPSGP